MYISLSPTIRTIAMAWLIALTTPLAQAQLTARFGANHELDYDLQNGTYSVRYDGKPIIENALSVFEIDGIRYDSKQAEHRTYSKEPFQDGMGSGMIYRICWQTSAGHRVCQSFRCYTEADFLITGLAISGDGILRTKYLAPLIASRATLLGESGQASVLFVPFDNDTFIRYDANSLSAETSTSSEVGAVFDPETRHGLVVGSVDQRDWKSAVSSRGMGMGLTSLEAWAGYTDVDVTRDSIPHGYLCGDTLRSPDFFVGYFADWREGMQRYAQCARVANGPYIRAWQGATPIGWNSWGTIQENLTYEKAIGVVDFFHEQLPGFRNVDHTAYIDLDSYWDNMVDGGLRGDFSRLKAFADHCRKKGLQPGIYWAPFTDWGHGGDPSRIAEGSEYPFEDLWTRVGFGYHDLDGGRALDPTHPGTQQRIRYVIGKLKECGFSMIKIDFLGHAAIESTRFHDPTVTTGMQAYRMGMECLSDALDDSMLIYAAISPSIASTRYVHMRRIACDAWKSIEDTEYTLNSVTYGWWQDGLYDYIDADHLVFEGETVQAQRARLLSGLVTGPVVLGDDFSVDAEWHGHIKHWLQQPWVNELVADAKTFLPVQAGTGISASRAFVRHDDGATWLAAFNYEKQSGQFHTTAEALGLDSTRKYRAEPVLEGRPIHFSDRLSIDFETEGAQLFRIVAE